jgi:hypothetical protein
MHCLMDTGFIGRSAAASPRQSLSIAVLEAPSCAPRLPEGRMRRHRFPSVLVVGNLFHARKHARKTRAPW